MLAAAPSGRHPSIKDMNKHGLTPLGEALVAGRCDVAELLVKEARDYCSMLQCSFLSLLSVIPSCNCLTFRCLRHDMCLFAVVSLALSQASAEADP